ncbi:hypothetical protein L21SP5_00406 [Salinivirga cyanobacteriivorans]|uniref:YdhG-like domain-containing protein n=1 Tax=Salinivirga cyanobacteriivorans TaxID=1307839 RepID=A0A0S2HVS0_9BACT|nr:DUF1801 domain-containing protein [Salinivirga cyanobacteriivorans]ALO14085.1 hypothetical protein L21SP5_00406 [Salinivirga cyanobacteriivorans]
MLHLHMWLLQTGFLKPRISYGIPFYYGNRWVCFLNPLKKGGVELAFTRGNELQDEPGILDNKGRKLVYGVELDSIETIPHEALEEVLFEALDLDRA